LGLHFGEHMHNSNIRKNDKILENGLIDITIKETEQLEWNIIENTHTETAKLRVQRINRAKMTLLIVSFVFIFVL